jgi:NADH:ubiquinone oxidoreductase subunit E
MVENLNRREIAKYLKGGQSSIIVLLWRAQEQAGGWLTKGDRARG